MQAPLFKIRASAAIKIMGEIGRPTEKQLIELAQLEGKTKLTELQAAKLAELQAKRDSKPQLSAGSKTYCKEWLKEQLFGKKREISSKYTEKGIAVEQQSIELICRVNKYGDVQKNEVRYSNDWAEGTPDMVHTIITDAKSSWAFDTFPFFETKLPDKDKGYEWQVQVYMWLTGLTEATIEYTLVDTPDHIIEYEANKISRNAGFDELDADLYEQVRTRMTYGDVPEEYRVKKFGFAIDSKMIEQIKGQVELCRTYIETELMPIYNAIVATPVPVRDNTTLTESEQELLNKISN